MIADGRSIASGTILETDVCIVGAGPAGITIAQGFASHSASILLLESGGTNPREATQSLCEGVVSGLPYYPLHSCRLRLLGGSTNFWGGWRHPLDSIDFEERDWLPFSGWPFRRQDLAAEYTRAHAICQPRDSYSEPPREGGNPLKTLADHDSPFGEVIFTIAPTRFGEAYRGGLEKARNTTLVLNANALEIELDRDQRTALSIRAATVAGNAFMVRARVFVLAAGGIENPRILLGSRRGRACGIGNENDLVGRFFADHIHFPVAVFIPDNRTFYRFFQTRRAGGIAVRRGMSLTEEFRHRNRLLGFAFTVHNADDPHDVVRPPDSLGGYGSLQSLARSLRQRELPERLGHHAANIFKDSRNTSRLVYRKFVKPRPRKLMIGCRAEQVPNRNSRVLLDDSKDRFGMNRVRLEWRLSEQDYESFLAAQKVLQEEFVRNTSKAKAFQADCGGELCGQKILPAAHHIGTTRMHRSPKLGVVDENCRVHGVSNLYIAGSSVFPTSGWAPPTLTIVALAIRLADHLKECLR